MKTKITVRGVSNAQIKKVVNNKIKLLQSGGPNVAKEQLQVQLKAQQNPDGSAFPTKAPSTIAQYNKHGWNTKDYLIRTGDSSKLKIIKTPNGFEVEPKGKEILSKFKDKADFMFISSELANKINSLLNNVKEEI